MYCNNQIAMGGQETATCGELYYSNTIKFKCVACIKRENEKMVSLLSQINNVILESKNEIECADGVVSLGHNISELLKEVANA